MATRHRKPRLRRKNLILDQGKIDRARRVLGAATDTEAITQALDTVAEMAQFHAEVDAGFARLIGRGGFVDEFPGRSA